MGEGSGKGWEADPGEDSGRRRRPRWGTAGALLHTCWVPGGQPCGGSGVWVRDRTARSDVPAVVNLCLNPTQCSRVGGHCYVGVRVGSLRLEEDCQQHPSHQLHRGLRGLWTAETPPR